MFIFLSGKRCSGKDTCARLIQSCFSTSVIDAFANMVRFEISKMYHLEYERLLYDYEYKNEHREKMIIHAESEKSVHGHDFWAKKLIEKYENDIRIIIVSDLRFEEEYEYIRQHTSNSIFIRISSTNNIKKHRGWIYTPRIDDHISETGLDHIKWFHHIHNDGTLDELQLQINSIIHKIDNAQGV